MKKLINRPEDVLADALKGIDAAHPDLEGPWNSQIFVDAQKTGGRSSPACKAARKDATPVVQRMLADLLKDVDAIVAPTNGPAWLTDPVGGDLSDGSPFIGSSSASAISGWADITVPAGYVDGALPIGVTFIGGRWDEPDLIGFAFDFEEATQVRVPPQYLPTLP